MAHCLCGCVWLRGGGVHGGADDSHGSSFIALGGNISLVLFDSCNHCAISGFLLAHALVGELSSVRAATTETWRTALAGSRREARRRLHWQRRHLLMLERVLRWQWWQQYQLLLAWRQRLRWPVLRLRHRVQLLLKRVQLRLV